MWMDDLLLFQFDTIALIVSWLNRTATTLNNLVLDFFCCFRYQPKALQIFHRSKVDYIVMSCSFRTNNNQPSHTDNLIASIIKCSSPFFERNANEIVWVMLRVYSASLLFSVNKDTTPHSMNACDNLQAEKSAHWKQPVYHTLWSLSWFTHRTQLAVAWVAHGFE